MKYCGKGLYAKTDVIMFGQETIGSAERSCNADEMYKGFMEISGGEYSSLLFEHFTRGRVLNELEQYLSHDFFPRFGVFNRSISLLCIKSPIKKIFSAFKQLVDLTVSSNSSIDL